VSLIAVNLTSEHERDARESGGVKCVVKTFLRTYAAQCKYKILLLARRIEIIQPNAVLYGREERRTLGATLLLSLRNAI
jgi:hypothetical protein